MIRLTAIAALFAGLVLSLSACTNTVRGLGADLNNHHLENYNNNMATDVDR